MYNYALNKEQREAAYEFVEALEAMKELGVSIIREETTGMLCMVNTQGFQLDTTGKRFPVVGKLSTETIDTENIVCAFDHVTVLEEGESINVVPKIQVLANKFKSEE